MKKLLNIFFIALFIPILTNAKLTQPNKNLTIDYTVQNGDTFYKIAHEHHTTIKEVLEVNGMSPGAVIKVGQIIKVPLNTYDPQKSSKPAAAQKIATQKNPSVNPTNSYKVKNGDTLFTIARRHHTSISALLKANDLEMNAIIKVGQTLIIPPKLSTPVPKKAIAANTEAKTSSARTKSKNTYTVQPGDTLFSIARKNHIIISKLMKINHIGLSDRLQPGQTIRLTPGKQTFIADRKVSTKQAEKKKKELPIGAMPSYTVKKGDTLWKIARKHHLTLAQIRKLNKMSKKDRIHTGMVLAVGKAVKPKPKTYKVKKGDTLWLIAKKNNMSTKELRRLNHMSKKDRIHTGMVLALSRDAVLPKAKLDQKTKKQMIARLKKKGAKKSEIEAVLAKVKKSKQKNPNIEAMLAQIKKGKKKKHIDTPLRVAKKKTKSKGSRFSSAASILNGRSSSSGWSRGDSRVIRVAKRYLGRRYVWGAEGPRAFDCSGFTQYVMRKTKGVRLPRVSRKQAYYGKYVSRSHLRPGDLVFFDTSRRRRGYVNHVGIYIGNNKFIHASSARHRVVITSLNRPFYRARFKWGRRIN